jgi:transposase
MAKLEAKDSYTRVVESYNNENTTIRAISRDTGIPRSTVARYLNKYKKAVTVDEVQNQGRPSKLDDGDIKCITKLLSEKPFLTSKELSDELKRRRKVNVTPRTIRNHLHRLKYKNSRPRDVPMLTEAAKEKRLRFATENKDTDWEKIFFSDETMIQLGANLTCAWHQSGSRPLNQKSRFPRKLMFWSAVSTWSKFELFEIEGTVTAERYVGMLREEFVPWVRRQKKGKWIFQQDNAPSHTAKRSKAFLADEKIECLIWPPYSPDLNPIENLWGLLKILVDKEKPKTVDELRTIAKKKWAEISMDAVRNTIKSLPARLEKVIAAGGGNIDY